MEIPDIIQILLPKTWIQMSDSEKRFSSALIAYAAGDAFGAFYEFSEIVSDIPNELREKKHWPYGGTSDDTSLTILTLLALAQEPPKEAAQLFLESLQANQECLRGLGPTTRAALGMHVNEKEVDSIGFTNGAMMRTALLGLIFQDDSVRDAWVRSLSSTTHRSYAVESSVALARAFTEGKLEINSRWEKNNQGVSNDARVTLTAIGHVLSQAVTPLDAMRVSCSLGGDTDTVAALSASLIASLPGNYERVFEIPWLEKVDWNGIQGFTQALEIVFKRMAMK